MLKLRMRLTKVLTLPNNQTYQKYANKSNAGIVIHTLNFIL